MVYSQYMLRLGVMVRAQDIQSLDLMMCSKYLQGEGITVYSQYRERLSLIVYSQDMLRLDS